MLCVLPQETARRSLQPELRIMLCTELSCPPYEELRHSALQDRFSEIWGPQMTDSKIRQPRALASQVRRTFEPNSGIHGGAAITKRGGPRTEWWHWPESSQVRRKICMIFEDSVHVRDISRIEVCAQPRPITCSVGREMRRRRVWKSRVYSAVRTASPQRTLVDGRVVLPLLVDRRSGHLSPTP